MAQEEAYAPVAVMRTASGVGLAQRPDAFVPTADTALSGADPAGPHRVEAAPDARGTDSGQRPYAPAFWRTWLRPPISHQTRERRRAEPEDAIAAYRSTVNGTGCRRSAGSRVQVERIVAKEIRPPSQRLRPEISRRAALMVTEKPPITSTKLITIRRKNVPVAACLTIRNSTNNTMNRIIDSK